MWRNAGEAGGRRLAVQIPHLQSPILRLCLLLLSLPLLVNCRQVAPTVKIGLGYDAIYAARLAVREFNEMAGAGQTRIVLVPLDDSGDIQRAREAAASLIVDPEVKIVLGHWLPETTGAAAEMYERAGLPFILLGVPPLEVSDPASLPPSFRQAYAALTPFAETAGPYAGSTYEGAVLALRALEVAESKGAISREDVATALERLQYEPIRE